MSAVFSSPYRLAAIAYSLYLKQHELTLPHDHELGRYARAPFRDTRSVARRANCRRMLCRAEAERRGRCSPAPRSDYTVLAEAHRANDPTLYAALLGELMSWAARSESNLDELASFIATDRELRSSPALADAYLELWKSSPGLTTTARMLHLAALADDADAFGRAVAAAVAASREGRLPQSRPETCAP